MKTIQCCVDNLRFYFVLIIILLFVSPGHSQNIANYAFSTGTNESLTDMSTGTTQLIGANITETSSAVTNIGFDFLFSGVRYTQFSVNANGAMKLGSTPIINVGNYYGIDDNARIITYASSHDTGFQNGTGSAGKVHYKLTGSAPNRILIIEWLNMNFLSNSITSDGVFQVRLHESAPGSTSPGRIDMIYGKMTFANGNGAGSPYGYNVGIGHNDASTDFQGVNVAALTSTVGYADGNSTVVGDIANLNSASDGNRRFFSYNAPAPTEEPENLALSCISPTTISLSWTGTPIDATGYAIYRSDDGGVNYSFLANVSTALTSYMDSGLTPGTNYSYRIYFITESGFSGLSGTGQASGTTLVSGGPVYSVASGNWADGAIWSTGTPPTSSQDVVIGCGTSRDVTINSTTASAASLTIQSGSTFDFDASQILTVAGNLTNNGTLDLNGGTLNVAGDLNNSGTGTIYTGTTSSLIFNGSSASNLSNSGSFGQTFSTAGTVAIPDNGGIATGNDIPSAATLTSCTSCATMTVSVPAPLGIYTGLNSINISIMHTWSRDLDIYMLSPDNTVFLIATDRGGGLGSDGYNNITFSDAGSALPDDTQFFTAGANYRIEVGDFASYSGTMQGDWTLYVVDDSADDTGDLTSFSVTLIEDVSGFNDLTVNNPGGLTMQVPVQVYNQLTLTDGIIATTSTNLLVIRDNAIVLGGSSTSFVDGPVRKIGDDPFIFPIGDGAVWARLGITAPATVTSEFTAEYIDGSYANVDDVGTLNNVSNVEYWNLDRNSGSSSVNVTLYSQDFSRSGITDGADLRVSHWNGANWEDVGNSAVDGSSVTSGVVSSFSPFTFGSNSAVENPLPVELISFTAKLEQDRVTLSWTTATEINNDFFSIERSKDGVAWDEIDQVKGGGNSSRALAYQAVDKFPLYGTSYYRLRQVDFDGAFEYSNVVNVFNSEGTDFHLYPNPVRDILHVRFLMAEDDQIQCQLYDNQGRVVDYNFPLQQNSGSMQIDVSKFNPGLYHLKITGGSLNNSQSFIVR